MSKRDELNKDIAKYQKMIESCQAEIAEKDEKLENLSYGFYISPIGKKFRLFIRRNSGGFDVYNKNGFCLTHSKSICNYEIKGNLKDFIRQAELNQEDLTEFKVEATGGGGDFQAKLTPNNCFCINCDGWYFYRKEIVKMISKLIQMLATSERK